MGRSGNDHRNETGNILLAEDDRDIQEMIVRIVSPMGYRCHCVGNGQEAIDALSQDSFDIVITDILMPVLDGMALLEHVKRFYPSIDVLVVTAYVMDYSFTDLVNKGASDFITKPFLPDELLAKLRRISRERKLVRDFRIEINSHLNARQEIERSYRTLEVLNNLLRLSIEECPVEEILKNFILQLTSLPWLELESKGAAFLVGADAKGHPCLRMLAHHSLAGPLLSSCKQVPFGKCLCGMAAASKQVVYASSVDDRHHITYRGMLQHGHYCIPILTSEQELLGVFTLYIREGDARNPQAEQVLTAAASMLAGVIRRKRSEEQLQRVSGAAKSEGL